jgi:hypothetical protein
MGGREVTPTRRTFLASLLAFFGTPFGIPKPERGWELRRKAPRKERPVYCGEPKGSIGPIGDPGPAGCDGAAEHGKWVAVKDISSTRLRRFCSKDSSDV